MIKILNKKIQFGISLIVILVFCLGAAPGVRAAECKEPEYKHAEEKAYTEKQLITYFQIAHEDHHDYVNCLFTQAASVIIPAESPENNTSPQREECKPRAQITAAAKETDVPGLMIKAMNDYNKYSDYLDQLKQSLSSKLQVKPSGTFIATDYSRPQKEFQTVVEQELQYALAAIDRSLISFSAMQQAYVVHLHLLCMQVNLQKVMTMLDELVSVVTGLPRRIENASVH